jgi:hypothetical protein
LRSASCSRSPAARAAPAPPMLAGCGPRRLTRSRRRYSCPNLRHVLTPGGQHDSDGRDDRLLRRVDRARRRRHPRHVRRLRPPDVDPSTGGPISGEAFRLTPPASGPHSRTSSSTPPPTPPTAPRRNGSCAASTRERSAACAHGQGRHRARRELLHLRPRWPDRHRHGLLRRRRRPGYTTVWTLHRNNDFMVRCGSCHKVTRQPKEGAACACGTPLPAQPASW